MSLTVLMAIGFFFFDRAFAQLVRPAPQKQGITQNNTSGLSQNMKRPSEASKMNPGSPVMYPGISVPALPQQPIAAGSNLGSQESAPNAANPGAGEAPPSAAIAPQSGLPQMPAVPGAASGSAVPETPGHE